MTNFGTTQAISDLVQTLFSQAKDIDVNQLSTDLKRLHLMVEMLKKAQENLKHWQETPSAAQATIVINYDDLHLKEYVDGKGSIHVSAFNAETSPLYWRSCGILYRLLSQSFGIKQITAKQGVNIFDLCIIFTFPNPWFDQTAVQVIFKAKRKHRLPPSQQSPGTVFCKLMQKHQVH